MTNSTFKIDEKAIRSLAKVLHETNLQEIEYECAAGRLRVALNITPVASIEAPVVVAPAAPAPIEKPSEKIDWDTHPGLIKSPMVATVYLSPQPDASPFIKTGDIVKEGQTLLILEAMKVMNPLKAPKNGKIVKILVEDLSPIEFGQPLVIVE